MPWLDDLTKQQRAAVTHCGGPLLVLAGPGSGKTRVITRRICQRIAAGVPAWQILALTFTNKAAREMRTRVDALVPIDLPGRKGMTVSTFHAFSAGLLRRYAATSPAAGMAGKALSADFTIFSSDDSHSVIKSAIQSCGLELKQWSIGAVASEISAAKNRLQSASEYQQSALDFGSRTIARIYAAYERAMIRQDALDFDDLLMRTARMLRDDPATLAQLQARYTEVLVDEYQDTNHAQFAIAHAIASAHRSICVVGDPDQSIYGWRGADISNIMEFEEHYQGATVVALGENFRSTGAIVGAADALIRNNKLRRHKDLSTGLGLGKLPVIARLSDESAEAQFIVSRLQEANAQGTQWKDMAVLYRMNALSRSVEEVLLRSGIPYVIARGTAFYERREVRDTLSYLKAIVNPADDTALERIINVPARGIGATSISKLESIAQQRGCPLSQVLHDAQGLGIAARTCKSIAGLAVLLGRARSMLEVKPASELGPFVAGIITDAGLERAAMAYSDDEEDAIDRRANVQEVASAAAKFELQSQEQGAPEPTLGTALRGFLESVALISDADVIDPATGAVTLMSLHASKGLEFDTVAILGVEEGLLPHARAAASPAQTEEERRLLFVGITRARRQLLITNASVRTMRGMGMTTIESGFVHELGDEFVERFEPDWDHYSGRRQDRAQECGLREGTRVRHPQFGMGTVEAVTPRGDLSSARIRFNSSGTRTLILSYAKLEIISR